MVKKPQTTSALEIKFDEPSTSALLPDLKTASDISSEIVSLLCPKLTSSLYCTSSLDDILICESKLSSKNTSTSSSQPVTYFFILKSRPLQTLSCSSARSISSAISAFLRVHAQPNSSTSEKLPSSPFDIPIPLKTPSVIETSFTGHSDRSAHLSGD